MAVRKALIALLPFLALLCIAQQVEVRKVPIKPVNAQSGEKMYMAYCAVCHGNDGKGLGPAAPAMKVHPTNLRNLAKANGGKYPTTHVLSVIHGDTASLEAHGSKDMPRLGQPVFEPLHRHSNRAGGSAVASKQNQFLCRIVAGEVIIPGAIHSCSQSQIP